MPPLAALRRRRIRIAVAGNVGALGVADAVAVGVGTAGATRTVVGVGTAADAASSASSAGGWTPGTAGRGFGSPPGSGAWPGDSSTGSGTMGTAATTATDDQQIGVVDIDTVLGYADGGAAGTGMVLTSDGEILTNNHVAEV